ncbi:MAG TPA: hypothetical protein GYA10_05450 [Alphaproteobacteria bacterium]|nr:hypothetical protein [Alphaproteobacteria bacterium]
MNSPRHVPSRAVTIMLFEPPPVGAERPPAPPRHRLVRWREPRTSRGLATP